MDVTKLDAAKRQLATAIWLYFEDRDRISVHTLAMAAAEVIDRLCDANGTPGMRKAFMASIVPGRQKEAADALNAAFNFFKHASSAKPNQVLRDFDDDRNIIPLMFATDGVRCQTAPKD